MCGRGRPMWMVPNINDPFLRCVKTNIITRRNNWRAEGALLALPPLFSSLLGFRSAACEQLLIIPAKTFELTVSVRLAWPGGHKKWRTGGACPRVVGRLLSEMLAFFFYLWLVQYI